MSKSSVQKAESAHQPLFATHYLRSLWSAEYEEWRASDAPSILLERLQGWAAKDWQKETSAEGTFVDVFFKMTWGYTASGQTDAAAGFTLHPQFPVKNAGQKGHTGEADIALGYFGQDEVEPVPQVLGEFKDDRSGLDKKQNRTDRLSPVEQCMIYLREARRSHVSKVLPTWALVTDMNEFRLYLHGNKAQYQRFVLKPATGDPAIGLLDESDEAGFQRFLFARVFHADWLLATAGKSPLERLFGGQITYERALEADFYKEYQGYREHLFAALRDANPQYGAEGRLRRLVGLTQRLLDRFIFVLYCEDMGSELGFPTNILRELLRDTAAGQFYNESGSEAWTWVRRLFETMREGGTLGDYRIHKFNGGLFATDTELDNLQIPNSVFCARNQGDSAERLLKYPKTLLFFSAKYNFGATDDGTGRTLTLTAMGRIFEQSITDLEVMEARAAGRESLAEITKRKRDGVYYTPEWVTKYIVEETVGLRLGEIRTELGFDKIGVVTDSQIAENRGDRRKAKRVKDYERALNAYSKRLDELKVLDPACGSGAFLIQAFQFLYEQRQWIATELERVTGTLRLFDTHAAMRSVLANNLYGVDINAESIEITRLALWLHTALPDRPLTSLDQNIRCGNSLISTDFLDQLDRDMADMTEVELERINPFHWEDTFPDVFDRDNSGFDCIIGNPPYVKLQNFRRVLEDQATYLVQAKKDDGSPRYESTQTGNFDIYLPFIERGVDLLNKAGRLGYIAPSVWLVNEYGRGLRSFIKRTACMDRWLDFKAFQVFEEAMTYTSLQFFGGGSTPEVRAAFAPRGAEDVAAVTWDTPAMSTPWSAIPMDMPWDFMPDAESDLWHSLRTRTVPLEQSCQGISVGVQTSADHIYHLTRIGPGRWISRARGRNDLEEVEIEDRLMKPLISGPQTDRYQSPSTDLYLLFPYHVPDEGKPALYTQEQMEREFPKGWSYLLGFEKELRARERGKMDDDRSWWAYNYPKNLDKQEKPKLCVAQTVPAMRVCFDATGQHFLNNVRVNGIYSSNQEHLWFLLGVLNAPLVDFVFRRTAKPKAGGYFEANKQFIAPLPIPDADAEQKAQVAGLSNSIQELHTHRRDQISKLDRRLASSQCVAEKRKPAWIWAEVKTASALKVEAPVTLGQRDQMRWAKEEHLRRLSVRLDGLDLMLQAGATLRVELIDEELRLLVNGYPAIEGIFFQDSTQAQFVASQWRHATRDLNVTEAFDGKRLLKKLLALRTTENDAIVQQVIQLDQDIRSIDGEIERTEARINSLIYSLYGLTDEEIRLVEAG